MKKLLTLGLSLLAVVAALSLSACGQQDSGGSGETTTSGQPNQGGTATPNGMYRRARAATSCCS
jgi:uncharacterized lipoprotein YehR (DUF1307 family)